MVWQMRCFPKIKKFFLKQSILAAIIIPFFALFAIGIFVSEAQGFSKLFPDTTPKALKATTEIKSEYRRQKIKLGNKELHVRLAVTNNEHTQGLMFVESMATDDGMLFIFETEELRSFWMKNTYIDLDIGYFNAKGVLIDVQTMTSGKGINETRLESYPSLGPAKYALEMNKGWYKANKIELGNKLEIK